jgi:fumarylacetoacetate (FAA) hydrolase family protein
MKDSTGQAGCGGFIRQKPNMFYHDEVKEVSLKVVYDRYHLMGATNCL